MTVPPGLRPIVEMAAHRVAHALAQLGHRGSLREDRLAERACGQAPVRRFLDHEDDLVHKRGF